MLLIQTPRQCQCQEDISPFPENIPSKTPQLWPSHIFFSVQIRCGIVYNCIPKSLGRVTLVHVHVLRQSFIMLIQLFLWHSRGNTEGCHAKLCKLKFPIRDQEHRISPGFTFGHLVKCHNRSDLCSENSGRLTNGGVPKF